MEQFSPENDSKFRKLNFLRGRKGKIDVAVVISVVVTVAVHVGSHKPIVQYLTVKIHISAYSSWSGR